MGIERDSPPQSDSPNSEKLPSRTVEETSSPKPIDRVPDDKIYRYNPQVIIHRDVCPSHS